MKRRRTLHERIEAADIRRPDSAIDRDAGVIRNVRVLGRLSRNRHGEQGVTGTEYTPECMRAAIPLYEGTQVYIDHPAAKSTSANRAVNDGFGVLRNVRYDNESLIGDLHYRKTHQLANTVLEDAEREDLRVYGLSHNATSSQDRVDRATKRLVIERIESVRSVDLVSRPATNRNLWESEMKTTLRSIVEAIKPRWSLDTTKAEKVRKLLEMDGMGDMDLDGDIPAEETDPDEALWNGIQAAIVALIGQYRSGELDLSSFMSKSGDLLKAYEGLGDEAPTETETETPTEGDDDKSKTESVQDDVAAMKAELGARRLCESLSYTPKPATLKALIALPTDPERRALIEELRATDGNGGRTRTPRSGNPAPVIKPKTAADELRALRN